MKYKSYDNQKTTAFANGVPLNNYHPSPVFKTITKTGKTGNKRYSYRNGRLISEIIQPDKAIDSLEESILLAMLLNAVRERAIAETIEKAKKAGLLGKTEEEQVSFPFGNNSQNFTETEEDV